MEKVEELKLPRYVLYDSQELEIIIATGKLGDMGDFFFHAKLDTVADSFHREADKLDKATKRHDKSFKELREARLEKEIPNATHD